MEWKSYTLEMKTFILSFFTAATFEGLWEVSFQREYKSLEYDLICISLLYISRELKIKQILLMEVKLAFRI